MLAPKTSNQRRYLEAIERNDLRRFEHPQHTGLLRDRRVQRQIARMQERRAADALAQRSDRADVIDVGVRVDEVAGAQPVRLEPLRDLRNVIAAVDHDRLAAGGIAEHRAVAGEHPDRERFDDHGGGSIAKSRY